MDHGAIFPMMKALILLLLLPIAFAAQTKPCTLELKDAPAIRGLRLGMPRVEAQKTFPGEATMVLIQKEALQKTPGFEGVDLLSLSFISDRLAEISVLYEQITWRDSQEFASRLSETMGLPAESWIHSHLNSSGLICKEFTVTAIPKGSNVVIASNDRVRRGSQTD